MDQVISKLNMLCSAICSNTHVAIQTEVAIRNVNNSNLHRFPLFYFENVLFKNLFFLVLFLFLIPKNKYEKSFNLKTPC